MTCNDARRAMHVAEREELRAEGGGVLAMHLQGCASCRAIAIRLEAGSDLLSEMVIARGNTTVVAHASRRRIARIAGYTVVPLAAAAAIAFMVSRREPAAAPLASAPDATMTSVSVDVEPGQMATVIKTADPKITVVWLSSRGTE